MAGGVATFGHYQRHHIPRVVSTHSYSRSLTYVTVARQLANKRIIFNCDNEAVVAIINKKYSKSERIMAVFRRFILHCVDFNITCKAKAYTWRT